MAQQLQPQPDGLDQQVAALEAELFRTYRIIKDLREENARLQEENAYLQNIRTLPPTVVASRATVPPTQQPRYKTQYSPVNQAGIPGSGWAGASISQGRFARLSRLQFAGFAAVIAGLIIALGGLAVMRLTVKRSPSLPTGAPQLPTSAPSPVTFPGSAEPGSPTSASADKTHPSRQKKSELAYNVQSPPNFKQSQDLQAIVNAVVDMAAAKQLPLNSLSISLIDLKSGKSAGYQSQILRFPASVSKLFWMVALYAQVEKGRLPADAVFYTADCKTDICKMVQKSDNEAGSRILDELTGATSGEKLEGREYDNWLSDRQQINKFYQAAGYENIDVSQKNFPIPYLKMEKPQGRDLQMRGDSAQPIRNKISTEQAARLMSEIFTSQAVAPRASQEMMRLLTRDLQPEAWKQEQYNSIQGFLGEYLPIEEVYFASKVGWTFGSRQEAAYIATKDGKAAYILVIFGDDSAYGDDWKIFPEMSLYVFNRMSDRR